jgi:hypothetical protein
VKFLDFKQNEYVQIQHISELISNENLVNFARSHVVPLCTVLHAIYEAIEKQVNSAIKTIAAELKVEGQKIKKQANSETKSLLNVFQDFNNFTS